jgi:hypothetical protein
VPTGGFVVIIFSVSVLRLAFMLKISSSLSFVAFYYHFWESFQNSPFLLSTKVKYLYFQTMKEEREELEIIPK